MDLTPITHDPRRIFEIAAESACSARLFLPGAGEAFSTTVLAVDDQAVIFAPVRPAHGNLVLERIRAGLRLEVTVSGLPLAATIDIDEVGASGLRVRLPDRVSRIQRRRYFRVSMPAGSEVSLQIGDELRSRALIDISSSGAAFRAHSIDVDLIPGTSIELIQFPLSAGRSFIAAARVMQRATRGPSWATERIVGVEFEAVSARDRARLGEFLLERERQVLRERSRDPECLVDNAVLIVRGPGNRTRLRTATSVGARIISMNLCPDDDDLAAGLVLDDVELRVAGTSLLRSPMRVEKTETNRVTLAIPELPPSDRNRLLLGLRAIQ